MNNQPDLFAADFNLASTEQQSLPTMAEIAERSEAVAKEASRQESFLETPKKNLLG